MENKKKWTAIIVAQLIVYVILTAYIFIYHKKLNRIDKRIKGYEEQKQTVSKSLDKKKYDAVSRQQEIEEQKQLLEANSQCADVHFELAQSYMQRQKTEKKALKHLERVIEIDSDYPQKKIIELWIKKLKKRNKR